MLKENSNLILSSTTEVSGTYVPATDPIHRVGTTTVSLSKNVLDSLVRQIVDLQTEIKGVKAECARLQHEVAATEDRSNTAPKSKRPHTSTDTKTRGISELKKQLDEERIARTNAERQLARY
jgi:hypothetical protein